MSRRTVSKLARSNGIRRISPGPWVPVTAIADEVPHTIPDLVERHFDRGEPNRVWTSDITYLATSEGWLYLCAVRDGCSRRVLRYAFADRLHTDVVESAMRRVVMFRDPATGSTFRTTFHADRGCQCTSDQLHRVAKEVDVRLSVGRTGVCWDNAQQESVWSSLKTELYRRHQFTTRRDAIWAVTTWIEDIYNRRRRHSALGQISPVEFETRHINAAVKAAWIDVHETGSTPDPLLPPESSAAEALIDPQVNSRGGGARR
ncbi:IS3 family transposase [Nakamurella sp. A5-74]|uniref:IS3 family transposase n=1 Tax=Nakamurella sp. A5-74 TaxID=3158264 RepID=A0AAU8DUU9_9ACTN